VGTDVGHEKSERPNATMMTVEKPMALASSKPGGRQLIQASQSQPSMRPVSRHMTNSLTLPCGNILPMKLAEGSAKSQLTTNQPGVVAIGALSTGDGVRAQPSSPPSVASRSSASKKPSSKSEVVYF
jgi:hypothetical protein